MLFFIIYYKSNEIIEYDMGLHVATDGAIRNAKMLDGKYEGKIPHCRYRRNVVENVKTDHQETTWKDIDLIHVDQDGGEWWAVANMVLNLRLP
jgi:hypothetical protein